jgi:hypothetical protein
MVTRMHISLESGMDTGAVTLFEMKHFVCDRGVEQSDLLKLGMEIYSYNDHRSAPFSRAGWLVLPPPTLTRVREPTLSWNQLHSESPWKGEEMAQACDMAW